MTAARLFQPRLLTPSRQGPDRVLAKHRTPRCSNRRSYVLPMHKACDVESIEPAVHVRVSSPPATTTQRKAKRSVSPVSIIITDDDSSGETSSCCSSSEASTTTDERTYKVSFNMQVAVYEIPHRNSYDNKTALWNNRKEIKRQAARNTLEYTYERFHWQTAVEEPLFARLESGQLVHPAHVVSSQQSKQQQNYVLQERYRQRQHDHWCKQQVLLQTVHDLAFDEY
jgi:hypothetical protein